MGETGCGKTRLIKFMCELRAGRKRVQNMLLVKVMDLFFHWIQFISVNINYLQSYYSFHVLENQVELGKFLPYVMKALLGTLPIKQF